MASTASLVMVAISTIVLMAQRCVLTRRSYALSGTARARPRPLSRLGTVVVLAWTALVFLLVFTPAPRGHRPVVLHLDHGRARTCP